MSALPRPAALYQPLLDAQRLQLPALRKLDYAPCRHAELTLLIYWFPKDNTFDPCEFALRKTWSVLGQLPTIIVTHHISPAMQAFATATHTSLQVEPRLIPGDIWSMSIDCIARLYQRFQTRLLLIVQPDGWPLWDNLEAYKAYDFIGAPSVTPDCREPLADWLGITVLNGGFSLRSHRICKAAAKRYQWFWRSILKPGCIHLSEDIFYTRTLRVADPFYRLKFKFAPAAVARQFSEDTLNSALPLVCPKRMGFHGLSTFLALQAQVPKLTVVSVVRDKACYEKCMINNPFLKGCKQVTFDNTVDNTPIPIRYNQFLDHLPEDTEWILFAHEDFELKEDPRPKLRAAYPLYPYGTIGTHCYFGLFIRAVGHISDSRRDGSGLHQHQDNTWMAWYYGPLVSAFDCCGFFIHRTLIEAMHFRFDPHCTWNFYAEDLCYQFIQWHHHFPRILSLEAHHWSQGNRQSTSFKTNLAYMQQKYATLFLAGGTCVLTLGQKAPLQYRLFDRLIRTPFNWVLKRIVRPIQQRLK